jgi:hypothetical protein
VQNNKIMKKINLTVLLVPFFLFSCASPKLISYEPIKVFLESEKVDKKKLQVVVKEKQSYKQALRIFNYNEGLYTSEDFERKYHHDLFNEKHWRKMYLRYASDSQVKYWKKEDFSEYNFVFENHKQIFKLAFLEKYSVNMNVLILSEPMLYWNNKYVIFYYNYLYGDSSGKRQVVIMKKVKKKWIIVKIVRDYIIS